MRNENRQDKITRTAIIGIIANIFIASLKIGIGMLTSSIAIASEGINNATDAGSSFLTLAGAKLSGKHPDEKHPFGYGRIEYLTGLVIGIIILYAGIGMLRESVDGILHPIKMEVTVLAILIVFFSAVVKFFVGVHTIKVGKETESGMLTAVGEECRNDSFFSGITILSSIVFLVWGLSLDAYAGIIFSIVVMKTGYEALKETVSEILGRPGKEELAKQLYKEIRGTEGIISVADMMLHNYGPDKYSGSVNIEIDHKKKIGDIYEVIHELQLRIMHEYHVTMVFGIYAVDYDSEESKEMRNYIGQFVKERKHVKSFHALFISSATNTIYCDIIVDYKLKNWEALEKEFSSYMALKYPEYGVELTVETEFI